ncbi:MAG: PilN domain-containing protein [Bryobacteraceae bacterium]|nr:PilN domain-containing protein [Bryobacteraceae bacterium]
MFGTNALTYAAALAGACPWLGIEGNVLPAELRRGSSRVRLIPTITLAVILAALLIVLGVESSWFDSRYLAVLQHQISLSEPAAKRVDAIDRAVAATRARSQSLDDFKRRPRLDMDSLAEVTKLIPAPGWVSGLDMDRQTIQIAGEAEQAATLLKTFDNSPLFERSEFSMPIMRATAGEMFRVRSARTAPIPGFVAPPAQPIALPKPVPGAAK